MDNNNEHKPEKKPAPSSPKKKKVSKKVIRQRQLCALAIIALVILIIIILIAKGCSNSGTGEGEPNEPNVTTTAPAETEPAPETTPPETLPPETTTVNPLVANVQLDKRELFVTVGDESSSIYARILNYPDENTGEANEVWRSMDESIATVNSWGAVTGVAEGETFIILSFDNHPEVEIEIKVHVASGGAMATVEAYPEVTAPAEDAYEPAVDTPTTPVYGYTDGLADSGTF